MLVRILALTESDVKACAGLFSGYRRNEKDTLIHFQKMQKDECTKWNLEDLKSFCRTRRIGCRDKTGKKLRVDQLLRRIETQLDLEVRRGRETYIICPRKSQLPYNKRRLTLVRSGILNVKNCRRLVDVKVPDKLDARWRLVMHCIFMCTNLHDTQVC